MMVSPFSHNYWAHIRIDCDYFERATNVLSHPVAYIVHSSSDRALELPELHSHILPPHSKRPPETSLKESIAIQEMPINISSKW